MLSVAAFTVHTKAGLRSDGRQTPFAWPTKLQHLLQVRAVHGTFCSDADVLCLGRPRQSPPATWMDEPPERWLVQWRNLTFQWNVILINLYLSLNSRMCPGASELSNVTLDQTGNFFVCSPGSCFLCHCWLWVLFSGPFPDSLDWKHFFFFNVLTISTLGRLRSLFMSCRGHEVVHPEISHHSKDRFARGKSWAKSVEKLSNSLPSFLKL